MTLHCEALFLSDPNMQIRYRVRTLMEILSFVRVISPSDSTRSPGMAQRSSPFSKQTHLIESSIIARWDLQRDFTLALTRELARARDIVRISTSLRIVWKKTADESPNRGEISGAKRSPGGDRKAETVASGEPCLVMSQVEIQEHETPLPGSNTRGSAPLGMVTLALYAA